MPKVSKRNSRETTRKTYKESVAAYAEKREHTNRLTHNIYRQPKLRMSKVFVVITMAHLHILASPIIFHTYVRVFPNIALHSRSISVFYWQKSYIWLNIHRNHAQYTRRHTISFGALHIGCCCYCCLSYLTRLFAVQSLLCYRFALSLFLSFLMNDVVDAAAAAAGFFPRHFSFHWFDNKLCKYFEKFHHITQDVADYKHVLCVCGFVSNKVYSLSGKCGNAEMRKEHRTHLLVN